MQCRGFLPWICQTKKSGISETSVWACLFIQGVLKFSKKRLRPLGAGHSRVAVSSIFLVWASSWELWVWGGGRRMNAKTLMLTSAVPEWSSLEKWSPTAAVCFLCLMLNICELNLCVIVLLVLSYIFFWQVFAGYAVNQIWTFADACDFFKKEYLIPGDAESSS